MREDGYITGKQEQENKNLINNFQFPIKSLDFHAPHFVEFIKKQLIDKFGGEKSRTGKIKCRDHF